MNSVAINKANVNTKKIDVIHQYFRLKFDTDFSTNSIVFVEVVLLDPKNYEEGHNNVKHHIRNEKRVKKNQ